MTTPETRADSGEAASFTGRAFSPSSERRAALPQPRSIHRRDRRDDVVPLIKSPRRVTSAVAPTVVTEPVAPVPPQEGDRPEPPPVVSDVSTGSPVAPDGEALILSHREIAARVALKHRGRGAEVGDLLGEADVALVAAAARYDGTGPFIPYLIETVDGAVRNKIRDVYGLPVSVPRSFTDDRATAVKAQVALEQTATSTVTPQQVAEATGLSAGRVREVLQVGGLKAPERFGHEVDGNRPLEERVATLEPDDPTEALERYRALHQAIEALPDDQKALVMRYFFDGALQDEIAAETGVSQMTVSRRVRDVKDTLRDSMVAAGSEHAGLGHEPAATAEERYTASKGLVSSLMTDGTTASGVAIVNALHKTAGSRDEALTFMRGLMSDGILVRVEGVGVPTFRLSTAEERARRAALTESDRPLLRVFNGHDTLSVAEIVTMTDGRFGQRSRVVEQLNGFIASGDIVKMGRKTSTRYRLVTAEEREARRAAGDTQDPPQPPLSKKEVKMRRESAIVTALDGRDFTGPGTIKRLAQATGSRSTLWSDLHRLSQLGIIESRGEGGYTEYRLTQAYISQLRTRQKRDNQGL